VVVIPDGGTDNVVELAERLRGRGHSTPSDTEVIVDLYEDHGVDCVEVT
jgi:asparagine synthetase B (glutamine-hydrolysing)